MEINFKYYAEKTHKGYILIVSRAWRFGWITPINDNKKCRINFLLGPAANSPKDISSVPSDSDPFYFSK